MDIAEKDQIASHNAVGHWYYAAKYALLQKHINALQLDPLTMSTVDVGCGLGLFLHKLESTGYASPDRAIGVDPGYEEPSRAFSSSIPILPDFPSHRLFDLLLLMDVLEHVPNDSEVLRNATSRVRDGGYIFITVPAMPLLFSSHDRYLGHYRRYTLHSLRSLIRVIPGISLLNHHYFFASPLPLAIPMRLIDWGGRKRSSSDMRPVPSIVNYCLSALCHLELQLCTANHLAGLTAVAVCSVGNPDATLLCQPND